MVLDDIYSERGAPLAPLEKAPPAWENRVARPLDRMAGFIADGIFLSPAASLILAPFRRESLLAQLTGSEAARAVVLVEAAFATLLLAMAYQAAFVAFMGATPGQRMFGLEVVSTSTGLRPRAGAALTRAFAFGLEALALGLPWLAACSHVRRRVFHDRASETVTVAQAGREVARSPEPSEAAAANGAFSAGVAVIALVLCGALAEGRKQWLALDSATEIDEAAAGLCEGVAAFRREWIEAERPSRLEAALALTAAGSADSECLDREADREVWSRFEGRALAYAAKAVANADESALAETYANRACQLAPNTDSCRLAKLARRSAEIGDVDTSSSVYLPLFLAEAKLDSGDYAGALRALDAATPRRQIAAFLGETRARALWALGEMSEARGAWTVAAAAAADSESRGLVQRRSCSLELERGCSNEARASCAGFRREALSTRVLLRESESVVAFVRGGECAEGDKWNAKSDASAIPTAQGRAYALAVERLRRGKSASAVRALEELSEAARDDDAIALDARTRLVEAAGSVAEAEEVRATWESASPGDGWRRLGLALQRRFADLGDTKRSLEISRTLRAEDPTRNASSMRMPASASSRPRK